MNDRLFVIRRLSQDFYNDYDSNRFPEILRKIDRPYMVIIVKIDNNTFAIPFRTNIRHKSGFMFTRTCRNTQCVTGLDFSKSVIVNDSRYIGEETTIDNLEYTDLSNQIRFIIQRFTTYINGYKRYAAGKLNEFESRKYKYTTLKYFHKELGIISESENKHNT